MLKAIIVDDEIPALEEMEYMLEQFINIQVLESFHDPVRALEMIKEEPVDVVFLDIEMPEMDGFSVAHEIYQLNKNIQIIFVTAFDQYAIQAFEMNALDYILKPICEDRLKKSIDRIQINKGKADEEKDNKTIQIANRANKLRKIPVWKNDRIIILSPEEIIYCKVEGGDTILVTCKGSYETKDSLSYYETILGSNMFFRCHRSFLINLEEVEEIIPWFNNTYVVKLSGNEEEIPVSRRHMKEFKERLNLM